MRPAVVLAVAAKELARPAHLALAAFLLVASSAAAAFLGTLLHHESALRLVLLQMAAALTPFAAALAGRDRASGFAQMLGASAMRRREDAAGKALVLLAAVAALLLAGALATLPAVLARRTDPALWGLFLLHAAPLALSCAFGGHLVGLLAPRSARLGLVAGFVLGAAWLALPYAAAALAAAAPAAALLARLSPLTWALEGVDGAPGPGGVVLCAALLAACVATAATQDLQGARRVHRASPAAWAAAALLALACLAWPAAAAEPAHEVSEVRLSLSFRAAPGDAMAAELRLQGAPGAALALADLRLASRHVTLDLLDEPPARVALDEEGRASVPLRVRPALATPDGGVAVVTASWRVDGEAASARAPLFLDEAGLERGTPPSAPVLGLALAGAAALLVAGRVIPGRANRW